MSSLDICTEVLDSVSSLFNLDYSMRIVWNLSQIHRRQLLCKQRVNSDGLFIFLPQQFKPQTGGKVSSPISLDLSSRSPMAYADDFENIQLWVSYMFKN